MPNLNYIPEDAVEKSVNSEPTLKKSLDRLSELNSQFDDLLALSSTLLDKFTNPNNQPSDVDISDISAKYETPQTLPECFDDQARRIKIKADTITKHIQRVLNLIE